MKTTQATDYGKLVSESFKRETGFTRPRSFTRRVSASECIVKRLNLYGKLIGHEGCVNAVEFNSTGELLVSGSDDRRVIFWDWAAKSIKLSYRSGHVDNIFQTKVMPFSGDRKIVTSAGDGQVRLGQVSEAGHVNTKRLGKHKGRVYKLAVELGSPYIIYSCGEDGIVQHFDLRSNSSTKLFSCTPFKEADRQGSNIRLNSIVIDPANPYFIAVGGSDEYVRLYDIRKCQWDAMHNLDSPVNTFCPRHLREGGNVHITGLAYSHTSELLVSYNDELIYMFQKNMGIGPNPLSAPPEESENIEEPQVYTGHRNSQTVKGVNFFGSNDEYVMSGSDCGHIFIWKKKGAKLVRLFIGDRNVVNQLESHPSIPVLATCGIERSAKIWMPMSKGVESLPANAGEVMESNRQGREDHSRMTRLSPDVIMHVLRLQRRQTLAYIERQYTRVEGDSDEEDEEEAYILGLGNGNATSEDPGECNIS